MMKFEINLKTIIMKKIVYLLVTAISLGLLLSSCQDTKTCSAYNSYNKYQKKDNRSQQTNDNNYKQYQKKVNTSKHSSDKDSKHYQKENPF